MRIIGSAVPRHTEAPTPAKSVGTASLVSAPPRFSVLNDFRYLTESDRDLIEQATGERLGSAAAGRGAGASAFAQQLALDRRTGELAPNQEVTAVYLRNASAAIESMNQGRAGFRNPYSGDVLAAAVAHLESVGRARADVRL